MKKKRLVLASSAFYSKALGDVELFADFYKDSLQVIIISDLYEEDELEINNIFYVRKLTPLALYYTMCAEYVIDAGATNLRAKMLADQYRVSVWHGVAYKTMYVKNDTEELLSAALQYSYSYDKMISPSSFYTKDFIRESILYTGDVLEIGSSRCDNLFKSDQEKLKIYDELGIDYSKKIVFYAPTFRVIGDVDSLALDPSKVLEVLGDEYVLLVKLHYLNTYTGPSNDFIDVTSYTAINNLLSVTDVLITDYSSLLFDYSILNQKLILFQYDLEEYSKRGFNFDMSNYLSSEAICFNTEQLYQALTKVDTFKNTLKENFYPYEKGETTQKIVDTLQLDTSKLKETEIIITLENEYNDDELNTYTKNLISNVKQKYNTSVILIIGQRYNEDIRDSKLVDYGADLILNKSNPIDKRYLEALATKDILTIRVLNDSIFSSKRTIDISNDSVVSNSENEVIEQLKLTAPNLNKQTFKEEQVLSKKIKFNIFLVVEKNNSLENDTLNSLRKLKYSNFDLTVLNYSGLDLNKYNEDSKFNIIDIDFKADVNNIVRDNLTGDYATFIYPWDSLQSNILKKANKLLKNNDYDTIGFKASNTQSTLDTKSSVILKEDENVNLEFIAEYKFFHKTSIIKAYSNVFNVYKYSNDILDKFTLKYFDKWNLINKPELVIKSNAVRLQQIPLANDFELISYAIDNVKYITNPFYKNDIFYKLANVNLFNLIVKGNLHETKPNEVFELFHKLAYENQDFLIQTNFKTSIAYILFLLACEKKQEDFYIVVHYLLKTSLEKRK